jgi:peptide deformylase
MLLKLYQAGQPTLRKKAKHVSKQLLATKHTQDVIDFMISTLRDAPGVGLAAPQVGESLKIIIIEDKPSYVETVPKNLVREQKRKPLKLKVLVNPTLEVIDSETSLYFEGCLSVDGYVAAVARNKKVKVRALDRNGKEITFIAEGWQARILQHEIDHLFGTLYLDKMIPQSYSSIKNFSRLWRKSMESDIRKKFIKV